MFHDYPVKYLPDEEIEQAADKVREVLFEAKLPGQNLMAGLRRFTALKIVPRPDEELGAFEAYVSFNPKRMFCKTSVCKAAHDGEVSACATVTHELGHFVLHPAKELRFLATDGNANLQFIHPMESAERQAWLFADCFQIPAWSIFQAKDAEALAELCNVSVERATRRWNIVRARPHIVVDYHSLEEAAWQTCSEIRGENPAVYRMAGIYRISRSEFRSMTQCGWFVEQGRAVAWMSVAHQW